MFYKYIIFDTNHFLQKGRDMDTMLSAFGGYRKGYDWTELDVRQPNFGTRVFEFFNEELFIFLKLTYGEYIYEKRKIS